MKKSSPTGALALVIAGVIGLATLRSAALAPVPAAPTSPAPAPTIKIDWLEVLTKVLTHLREPSAPVETPRLMKIAVDTEKLPGVGRIRIDGEFKKIIWRSESPFELLEGDRVAIFSTAKDAVFFVSVSNETDLDAEIIRVGKPTPAPPQVPDKPPVVTPDPTTRPTRATYVYEQRQGSVPPQVLVALDKLNRAGVVASSIDQNVLSGKGQIPVQYAVALDAAKKAGIPCLVVQAGDVVLRVVPRPMTADDVTKAVQ